MANIIGETSADPRKVTCPTEASGAVPRFRIGDLVETHEGQCGIIRKASGGENVPQYSMEALYSNFPLSKNSWWEASEFAEVILGPLHGAEAVNE